MPGAGRREDLIEGSHSLDDFFSECLPLSWCSNQDCWLDSLQQLEVNTEIRNETRARASLDLETIKNKDQIQLNTVQWKYKMGTFHQTLTASIRVVQGSCSWAQGFLKCWRDSLRWLTINPCNSSHTSKSQINTPYVHKSEHNYTLIHQHKTCNTRKTIFKEWLQGITIFINFLPLSPQARSSYVSLPKEFLSEEIYQSKQC